jgi:hypothetical protein
MGKWLGYALAGLAGGLVVLLILKLSPNLVGSSPGGDPRAEAIHRYLGNSHGDDPKQWTGLIGQLKSEATHFRPFIIDLNCRVRKLEGDPCKGEPPAGRPSDPPVYP